MIAPKTKKVITCRIELTFSLKSTKSSGCRARRPEGDAADERGDQPVAEGDVCDAVAQQSEPERVDALVPAGEPTARKPVHELAAADSDRDAQRRSERSLAEQLERLLTRVASRRGQDQEEEHERGPGRR